MTDWETLTTRSAAETIALGERLARLLRPGMVVALQGDLGSGKTVLTRGLAHGLGIAEPVTSPTFTVVQEYRRPDQSWFFHLDMYRIDSESAALAFGIEEYLFAPHGITVVEWPERIAGLFDETPTTTAIIHLEHLAPGQRRLVLPGWLLPDAESTVP